MRQGQEKACEQAGEWAGALPPGVFGTSNIAGREEARVASGCGWVGWMGGWVGRVWMRGKASDGGLEGRSSHASTRSPRPAPPPGLFVTSDLKGESRYLAPLAQMLNHGHG